MVCCREEWFAFDLLSSGQWSGFLHNLIEWTYWRNRARTTFLCSRETGLVLQRMPWNQIPCGCFLFEDTGNCDAGGREGSREKEIRYQPPSLLPIWLSSACEQTMRYQRSRGIGSLLLGHLMGPQNRKHGKALTNAGIDWMKTSQSRHSVLTMDSKDNHGWPAVWPCSYLDDSFWPMAKLSIWSSETLPSASLVSFLLQRRKRNVRHRTPLFRSMFSDLELTRTHHLVVCLTEILISSEHFSLALASVAHH